MKNERNMMGKRVLRSIAVILSIVVVITTFPMTGMDVYAKDWSLSAAVMDADEYINGVTNMDEYAETHGYKVEYAMAMGELRNRILFTEGNVTVTGELQTIAANSGANIISGTFAHNKAFSNFKGVVKGGTFKGGLRNECLNSQPKDTALISIDAGKTIYVGGSGIVNYMGQVLNNGTIDLSAVNKEEATGGKPLFNRPSNQSMGYTITNNGVIIFPDWCSASDIAALNMGGTGKYRVGDNEYANDYVPEMEFTYKEEFAIPVNKTEEAITSFSVASGVSSPDGTVVFAKESGPEWISVASDGTVSGTPSEAGTNTKLKISAVDNSLIPKYIEIPVGATYLKNRNKISQVTLISDIYDGVGYGRLISIPNVSKPGSETSFYIWSNADQWEWLKNDMGSWNSASGVFSQATYKLRGIRLWVMTGMEYTHEFDENVVINVGDRTWVVEDCDNSEFSHSYVDISSDEISVSSFKGNGSKSKPWQIGRLNASDITAYIENGILYINGTGEIKDFIDEGDIPWNFASVSGNIKKVVFSGNITKLQKKLFKNCSELTTVKLPNGIIDTEDSLFEGCTKLTEVNLPDSLLRIGENAFKGCTSLNKVTFKNLNSIWPGAFENCSSLQSIDLPDSLNYLGNNAFRNCTSLSSIDLNQSSLSSVGAYCFDGCTSLSNVLIPSNITYVNEKAFRNCTGINEVTIKNRSLLLSGDVFEGVGTSGGTDNPTMNWPEEWEGTLPVAGNIWYGGYFNFHMVEKPYIVDIEITSFPDKLRYQVGEYFETDGLVVTAHYSDGEDVDVTSECSIHVASPLTASDTTVQIEYYKAPFHAFKDFTINVTTEYTVKLVRTDYEYTGKAIKPSFTVTDEKMGAVISANNYNVFYRNNISANAAGKVADGTYRYATNDTVPLNATEMDAYLTAHSSELGNFDPELPYVVIQGCISYKGTIFTNFNIAPIKVFDSYNKVADGVTLSFNDSIELNKDTVVIKSLTVGSRTLVYGRDYTFTVKKGLVTYIDGTATTAPLFKTDTEDTYQLEIIAKGGYTGIGKFTLYAADKSELLSNAKVVVGDKLKKVPFNLSSSSDLFDWDSGIVFKDPSTLFATAKTTDKKKISVVMDRNKYLTTSDFDISYIGNQSVGVVTVVLTAKPLSGYKGTKTFNFRITGTALNAKKLKINDKVALKNVTFDAHSWNLERIYEGLPSVTFNGEPLAAGTHYKVSYLNNYRSGKATVIFTGIPSSGYTGTVKKTFTIAPAVINDSMVIKKPGITTNADYSKAGATVDDKIVVRLSNGYILSKGTDYSLKYTNNKTYKGTSTVGNVRVVGKGNFAGKSSLLSFTIVPGNIMNMYSANAIGVKIAPIPYTKGKDSVTYKPSVTVYDGITALKAGTDYKVVKHNYTNGNIKRYLEDPVGNAADQPYVEIVGNKGYFSSFTVKAPIKAAGQIALKATDTKLDISLGDVVYCGKALYPAVTVKYDGMTLTPGDDYYIYYGRTITGKGTVTVSGTGKYYGNVKKTFNVTGKELK